MLKDKNIFRDRVKSPVIFSWCDFVGGTLVNIENIYISLNDNVMLAWKAVISKKQKVGIYWMVCLLTFGIMSGCAQGNKTEQSGDMGFSQQYEKAKKYLSSNLFKNVRNFSVEPMWVGSQDRFWYKKQNNEGHTFWLVDAATGSQALAFDHAVLAKALESAGEESLRANALPITLIQAGDSVSSISVRLHTNTYINDSTYRCDLLKSTCHKVMARNPQELVSPDGKKVAFLRAHNIWLRDLNNGRESQLTTDGVEHFAYGDAGDFLWDGERSKRRRTGQAKALSGMVWSPDSRYLAALRADYRDLPDRPYFFEFLSTDGESRPAVAQERYPVAGESIGLPKQLTLINAEELWSRVVDIDPSKLKGSIVESWLDPENNLWWNMPTGQFFMITSTLGSREYELLAVDLASGTTRSVVREVDDHYILLNQHFYFRPNVHLSKDGTEVIWYSERDGWGHLYRYDVATGKLKNRITQGDWVVFDIVRVDEAEAMVYYTAGGRESDGNPYFHQLYRSSLNGGEPELLTPEQAEHEFTTRYSQAMNDGAQFPASRFSPSGEYFVDTYSTVDQPPITVIRDKTGKVVSPLIEADASALYAMGWQPPERFVVKAADGKTDLYGAMYFPSNFDPTKKYPVIEQFYPGPQLASGPQSFTEHLGGMMNNSQAYAELGFVVLVMDGRGTRERSKIFSRAFAGKEDVFGIEDHKAAIENLAADRPYMDINRVGITGLSYGGYASVRAVLLYPDFFKVSVSSAGPHDFRYFPSGFVTDRFFGVVGAAEPYDENYYDLISNTRLADRLQGKLLLMYGGEDERVPLQHLFPMMDAFVKADKDVDLVIVPKAGHLVETNGYGAKRSMKYFYEHL